MFSNFAFAVSYGDVINYGPGVITTGINHTYNLNLETDTLEVGGINIEDHINSGILEINFRDDNDLKWNPWKWVLVNSGNSFFLRSRSNFKANVINRVVDDYRAEVTSISLYSDSRTHNAFIKSDYTEKLPNAPVNEQAKMVMLGIGVLWLVVLRKK